MVLLTAFKSCVVYSHLPDILGGGDGPYVSRLFSLDVVVKAMASAMLQLILLLRRYEQAALVQCLVMYLSWCAPSRRSWRGMALVLAWFLISSIFVPAFSVATADMSALKSVKEVTLYVTDMLPSFHMMLADGELGALVTACVFLGRDVADDQVLQDVVRTSNRAHGAARLCCLLVAVMEAGISSFGGIVYLQGKIGVRSASSFLEAYGASTVVWGIVIMLRFIASCTLGQQLRKSHSRIFNTLHGFLARNALVSNRTNREVQGFSHQLQMQDCRYGVFDLLFFDFTTMGRVFGSFATFLVILFQFDQT
ncbi:uncharacterized protein LOC117643020 [Thrips palmi]|uniref:Gustatory receptor n=1 Tax=Thrips palmi TaxID=161013 RepID=A0A6P8YD00_THRPL|nr:uncharacterized protein LOC117643020 [Thrips palmi]